MSGTLAIIIGVLVVAVVVYLLIKQYETRMVLLGAGLLMCVVSLQPLLAFEAFSKQMTSGGLIQNICSVMGFAFVMKLTECDKHLIHALAKGLTKVRFALIPGAAIVTFLVNISLTSAAGVASAVGAVLIPLLMSLGVHPATAASAVMLGTFGSMLSPGLSHQPIIAKIAGMEVIDVIKVHMVADIAAVLIGAISLTIIAYYLKEHKGYHDPEYDDSTLTNFKVNPFFAVLPLLPVALLLVLSMGDVRASLEWASRVKVPHAMLLGAMICMIATRTSPAKASNEFFGGMGKAYGDVMGIIIAAAVFVAGMKSLGMIDAFLAMLKGTDSIVSIAATFGPFFLGVVSGSGDAAAIAFNEAVTPHAEQFGVEKVSMGSIAALAGALGRTMSPIAGAAIVCASLARVNPIEITKRNGIGMVLAAIAAMFILL